MSREIDPEAIILIMSTVWGIDAKNIPKNVSFGDFSQWDSVGHIQLITEIENRFSIEIGFETVMLLTSLDAIVEYLKKAV